MIVFPFYFARKGLPDLSDVCRRITNAIS